MWGNLWQNPLKYPIIAHCHLCLEMFEGKGLTNILKICGFKNVFDRMFFKHLIENISKTF